MTSAVCERSEAEKRAFARARFQELRRMGFSPACAGAIMREARPALAVRSAQWAKASWEIVAEYIFRSSCRGPDCRLDPNQDNATREELLNQVQGAINDLSAPFGLSSRQLVENSADKLAVFGLSLPSRNLKRLRCILRAAQEAVAELPIRVG